MDFIKLQESFLIKSSTDYRINFPKISIINRKIGKFRHHLSSEQPVKSDKSRQWESAVARNERKSKHKLLYYYIERTRKVIKIILFPLPFCFLQTIERNLYTDIRRLNPFSDNRMSEFVQRYPPFVRTNLTQIVAPGQI